MILSSPRSRRGNKTPTGAASDHDGNSQNNASDLCHSSSSSPSADDVVAEKCSKAAALEILVPSPHPYTHNDKTATSARTVMTASTTSTTFSSSTSSSQFSSPSATPPTSETTTADTSYFENLWSNVGWNTQNFFQPTRAELVQDCASLLYGLFQNAFQFLDLDDNLWKTSVFDYVDKISLLYDDEIEFHNWHHASHVLISTHHLMQHYQDKSNHHHHRRPSGTTITTITTNPITCPFLHFVMVLSALIHDVEHLGVTNIQLEKEQHELVVKIVGAEKEESNNHENNSHKLKDTKSSYLEAHSIVVGLQVMKQDFTALYNAIVQHYPYFCTLVEQVVLATDISSADRRGQCALHWQTAFGNLQQEDSGEEAAEEEQQPQDEDQVLALQEKTDQMTITMKHENNGINDGTTKSCHSTDGYCSTNGQSQQQQQVTTTTVISARTTRSRTTPIYYDIKTRAILEHIVQAADVSHCCQKFETFLQWNEALYRERLVAFLQNRGDDPRLNWYESNVGFFQFYIVPLATKCDLVLDMSGTILKQAKLNLEEWKLRGQKLTLEMQTKYTPEKIFPELSVLQS